MAITKIEETTHIYTLSDPRNGQIRYVGKANNIAHRYKLHLRKREGTRKCRWVQSLIKNGYEPTIEILDVVPRDEWQFWEMYWICQIKSWGIELYNGDNGGLGSGRLPQSVKDKIAKTLTGRSLDALKKPYAQYDLQGNYIQTFGSADSAAKSVGKTHGGICRVQGKGLSAYGFLWLKIDGVTPLKIDTKFDADGKIIVSDATRQALSIGSKGKNLGRKNTDETKLKMRLARLGVEPANKGKKYSQELIEQMKRVSTTKKAVVQLTLAGVIVNTFSSLKQAAEQTPGDRTGINRVIRGISKHSGGFRWEYA